MHPWHAAILGLVEGITEYLPVSSTGHLIVTSQLLGLKGPEHKDAIDAFEIVIQGGAILAVVGLYRARFVQMLRGLVGKDPAGFALLVNLAVAFVPAAAVGLLAKKWINAHLFYAGPVVAAMLAGGVYMLIVEGRRSGRIGTPAFHGAGKGVEDMTPLDALRIGLLQIFALWPGTSRSMMTITGGYFSGLRPAAAAEFSFLLGVPTLLAATGKALYDDLKDARAHGSEPFYRVLGTGPTLIGVAVAAVSAWVAVRWLVGFLNRRGLAPFGWYRLVVGVILLGLIAGGLVAITPETPAPKKGDGGAVAPARAPAGR